jgi:hypothetical protein
MFFLFAFLGLFSPKIGFDWTLKFPQHKGISLGLFSEDPYWSYRGFLREIVKHGASHVGIVVPWYQRDVEAEKIFSHPRFTVPDWTLKRVIRRAQKMGLRIFLFPILRLEKKIRPSDWRGKIRPLNQKIWFESYQRFILHYARLAQRFRVDLFCIGSELSSMDIFYRSWQRIIKLVREVYKGKIVYSANWDHYFRVPFWGLVDYLGIAAYFGLTYGEQRPEMRSLIHSWREIYVRLIRFQYKIKRRIIFTEVGYLSQKGASAWPWKEGADEPIDLEEQRRCYEALRRVWSYEPRLYGVYFWNWFGWGGKDSKEYTPRGKPASHEIKKWFFPF